MHRNLYNILAEKQLNKVTDQFFLSFNFIFFPVFRLTLDSIMFFIAFNSPIAGCSV